MVDFTKRLGRQSAAKTTDPLKIYDSLDRVSEKGPLRPTQEAVLAEWHANRRAERDIILKLHTGQGKTILGLLMLQSKLNEGISPALYLCPNKFLVNQTVEQANQFGVKVCVVKPGSNELPEEFLDGHQILVATVHVLFNGLTKFGLGPRSIQIGALLMDDAHACIDTIKDQCNITLDREENSNAYAEIVSLFEAELRNQGEGTFADIKRRDPYAYVPVPYWDWDDKESEVAQILSRHREQKAIRFAWPLLKDGLPDCLCLVSGAQVVIAPYLPPLDAFGSYSAARHRIFMSATITDDSFLIKGLGISAETIQKPLGIANERWSGEKMVLIPSLIHPELHRGAVVGAYAPPAPSRRYGVVALSPSAKKCEDWRTLGATVATKETIDTEVERLRRDKQFANALVIVNRYDGIDLPDDTCRVLILDSKPFAEELLDRYVEDRRPGSALVAGRLARTVEQGLGRAVRGEKDYCVVVLIGPDLVRAVRGPGTRDYFSNQTRTQIEIGLEIAEMATEEVANGTPPMTTFKSIVNQCLGRDEGWKAFYADRMNQPAAGQSPARGDLLTALQAEVRAEREFQRRNHDNAARILQELVDKHVKSPGEKGWYLQEIARYLYPKSKSDSNRKQIAAHRQNRYLLKPKEGMEFSQIVSPVAQRRVQNVIGWLSTQETFDVAQVRVSEILSALQFGVVADRFEQALDDLGQALGFACDRPDKEWKEGPDNLWGLRDDEYLLFECKSQVETDRSAINKDESDQMNKSSAWFDRHYPGMKVKRIMIIPTRKVASAAAFREEVDVMRTPQLTKLAKNVLAFFAEFRGVDLKDLSDRRVQDLLEFHKLGVSNLLSDYSEKVYAPPKA